MALSDLAVYSEYAYSTMTEVLAQQVALFNEATNGAIVLQSAAHQGDYSDIAMWAKVSGLVRRRNAYGTGAVSEKVLASLVDTMVKVAAGTPPVRIDRGQFLWIQQNPEIAGVVLGQQLAKDVMGDMLNTGLGVCAIALAAKTANTYDASGGTGGAELCNFANMGLAAAKFGDASNELVAWIMHSKPNGDLYQKNLANASMLFNFGTVNVVRDPMGRVLVVTDCPNLFVAGTPNKYRTLGLTPGGIIVHQNNDFDANEQAINGDENIKRTYQAEWSYQLGLKGFSWDKTNGGKSPADAALLTATNWDQFATSAKDTAGVVLISQ
jgi:hypothetical protein